MLVMASNAISRWLNNWHSL